MQRTAWAPSPVCAHTDHRESHRLLARLMQSGLALAAFMLALGMFTPNDARAQWLNTDALVANCEDENPEQQAFCVGYIAGTLHMLVVPPELMPKGQFCFEDGKQPTLTGFAENLIALHGDKPEIGKAPAFQVIAKMLEEGFPCGEDVPDISAERAAPPPPVGTTPVDEDFFGVGRGGDRPVIDGGN